MTINRPEKLNSLDFATHEALVEVWREFSRDDTARIGVITGSGSKAFCAGADLRTYTMSFATLPPHEFREKWVEGVGLVWRRALVDRCSGSAGIDQGAVNATLSL